MHTGQRGQEIYFPEVLTGVMVFDIHFHIINQKCLFDFTLPLLHFTMTPLVRKLKWLQKI